MLDTTRVADFIEDTARTLILPRFQALGSGDVREKGPGDYVTIADIEAEEALTRLLQDAAPGSAVVGEEAVASDPERLALLSGDRPVWIIDPVDGTGNFAAGRPRFAVIVAYVERGIVEGGWIYDPIHDVMVAARRGEGAWSGGRRLEVGRGIAPADMVGAAYGRSAGGKRAAKALEESGRVGGIRNLGSSGLEYMAMVLDQAQFSLHSRSLPWDHAAGMLIVAEAGGVATFIDGSAYDPAIIDGTVLATADADGFTVVRDVITTPGEAG
jgi:fructose-1,6-bisphosphatase/inositol monophosphatase family enzyme